MNTGIDILEVLFGGPGRTAILRLLASQTVPLTGREVAELTGLSPAGASRALEHLARFGVVTPRRVGRAVTHVLERDNLVVESIVLPALEAERTLLSAMIDDIATTFGPLSEGVVLFGSVGRGEPEPGSDIDVLIVTADAAGAVRASSVADQEGHRFYRRYGMPLSVIVTPVDALPASPTGFLEAAAREGQLVSGVALEKLMRRGTRR